MKTMTAAGQLGVCEGCGRDAAAAPYCKRCVGRGGRSRAADGFRDRGGWRDARVVGALVDDIDEDAEDRSHASERQWHGPDWRDD